MTAPWAQAIFTLIVGLSVAYIAWQQWQTAREKLALDLFEKRLSTYRILTGYFYPRYSDDYRVIVSASEVRNAAMETLFLFGDEVSHSIIKYYDKKLSATERVEVNKAMREMHKYMRFDAMPTKASIQLLKSRLGPRSD